jgi:hypothetical protein
MPQGPELMDAGAILRAGYGYDLSKRDPLICSGLEKREQAATLRAVLVCARHTRIMRQMIKRREVKNADSRGEDVGLTTVIHDRELLNSRPVI